MQEINKFNWRGNKEGHWKEENVYTYFYTEGVYSDGLRIDEWVIRDKKNNKLMAKAFYINGQLDGLVFDYNDDTTLKETYFICN